MTPGVAAIRKLIVKGAASTRLNDGRTATARRAAAKYYILLRARASRMRNRIYDRRNGVDTVDDYHDREFPAGPVFADAIPYSGVPHRTFRSLMASMRMPTDHTFIDVGCGKGAALLLAVEHGFRHVIGVELNQRLASIARNNLDAFTSSRLLDCTAEVIHGDAVTFTFPDLPTVLFLFNPFGPDTMNAVLDNLESSLRHQPRDCIIAYVNPKHAEELNKRGWLAPVSTQAVHCAVYVTNPALSQGAT